MGGMELTTPSPEEKLFTQTAIARHQSQSQKAKQYKRSSDSSATTIGYNAALGKNLIQLPDGSITYAGSDTNGATSLGESVPLHITTMRVDGLPNIKRQRTFLQKLPLAPTVTFSLWIRLSNFLLNCIGDSKKKKLVIDAFYTDENYQYIQRGEPGFANIGNNKLIFGYGAFRKSSFYIFDLNLKTFTETPASMAGQFKDIYSSCTAPDGTFFAAVGEPGSIHTTGIYRLNPDGSEEIIPIFLEGSDFWSIAATDSNTLYLVADYQRIYKFDWLSQTETIIVDNNLLESTFVFADSSNCYLFGTALDLIPALPLEITRSNYLLTGSSNDNLVVTGDFTLLAAGDGVTEPINGNYSGTIIQMLSSSSAEVQFRNPPSFSPFDLTINTEARQKRSKIWRIESDNSITEYFSFPGTNNSNGYQNFYNLPSRGAVINSKTKDIYMVGIRRDSVENGIYVGNKNNFASKNFVRISKNKKFEIYDLEFKNDIVRQEWNFAVVLEKK